MQYLGQCFGFKYFDPYDLIPLEYKLSGFNVYYETSYGSGVMKSNGLIFLEPSFFSQFLAIGFLLTFFSKEKKITKIIICSIYLLALYTSFSGTGLMLLAFGIIYMILKNKSIKLKIFLLSISITVIVLLFTSDSLSYFSNRIFEYRDETSSLSIRFINPYIIAFNQSIDKIIVGNGPGTSKLMSTTISANFSFFPKLICEYGLIGCFLFSLIIFRSFDFKHNLCSALILFVYLFLAGNLLQPGITLLLYFVSLIQTKNDKTVLQRNNNYILLKGVTQG
ncbi:MAG: hypothetical protein K5765_05525 [Clostridia bacterium]|nr:hypothetical protein [Clostridia bacterium]